MLELTAALLLASQLLFCQSALAELVAIPALSTHVTDLTGTLSAAEQAQLESKLQSLEQTKGSQIAVLILPTTQPEDIAQYSIRVADAWKIGRKGTADGVIVIIAKEDHKMRIEVGRGLEGAIPDLTAKRVISEVMSPKFKQGDFAGGLNDGVDKLAGIIHGEQLPAPKKASANGLDVGNMLPMLLFGGMISGLFLRSMFGTFFGSALNGGLVGGIVFLLGIAVFGSAILGVVAFFITMMLGGRGINGYPGGFGGGGFGGLGGGSSGGRDIFSGGGGDFGGGGASGSW